MDHGCVGIPVAGGLREVIIQPPIGREFPYKLWGDRFDEIIKDGDKDYADIIEMLVASNFWPSPTEALVTVRRIPNRLYAVDILLGCRYNLTGDGVVVDTAGKMIEPNPDVLRVVWRVLFGIESEHAKKRGGSSRLAHGLVLAVCVRGVADICSDIRFKELIPEEYRQEYRVKPAN